MSRCRIRIALIGCGAISELYYAPAIRELAKTGLIEVVALCDPDKRRLEELSKLFPGAIATEDFAAAVKREAELAIVASPQKFHAEQAIELLQLGTHVLCEKPMASNAKEAREMVATASKVERLLAVGLFRRFFPSSQFVKEVIVGGALGRPLSFEWVEGGPFNWPAASPSFFQKAASSGGVFVDIGTHVIDLLLWWFGEPVEFDYEDDSLGGLEANARLQLRFSSGSAGAIRLSRDTSIPSGTRVNFERGSIWFRGASADDVVLRLNGCSYVSKGKLHHAALVRAGVEDGFGPAARTYAQSFMEQILNFCRAIRGEETLQVPGEQALRGMDLIEHCYAARRLMSMPWMSSDDIEGAALIPA